MITQEKFFNAVEKIKVDGLWSLGLIIGQTKVTELDLIDHKKEKIIIDDSLTVQAFLDLFMKAFVNGAWVILEIKKNLSAEIYNQLKLLSTQNRLQLPTGEVVHQPGSVRIVAVVETKTLKLIEVFYPDFRYLFGPVINL